MGLFQILLKSGRLLQSSRSVIKKGVHFKVETKTPHIDIGSTHGAHLLIDDNRFGMDKSILIDINLGSGFQQFADVQE